MLSIEQLNPIEVLTPSEGLSTGGWPTAVKMFRKLRNHDGTPLIALDKDELEMDGVLEGGLAPDGKQMHVQRLGEGVYVVRDVSDGGIAEIPDIFHR